METVLLRVKRQDNPQGNSYWEDFEIPYRNSLNVVSALMVIQKNPVNSKGEKTNPVIWECNCLEEVCGACTMKINGEARQACSALIDNLKQPIILEPMDKFPVVRDLFVDRKQLFEALKKVKAWVNIDGTQNLGPAPRQDPNVQEITYDLSRCMTCGVCADACPNYNSKSDFFGPAAISQVRLFNLHPTGSMAREERLRTLMEKGGIFECGNSQNCVKACPKEISLTKSIAEMKKEVTWLGIKDIFRK